MNELSMDAFIPRLLSRAGKERALVSNSVVIAMGVLFLATASVIEVKLPFTVVPLTAQTLAVLVMGASFGAWRGGLSVALYLLLGCTGLPFFSGGASGLTFLAGPSGGYLFGFVAAASAMGWMAEKGWDRSFLRAWPLFLMGHILIFTFGLIWLSAFVGLRGALLMGFFPFIPGEIVKSVLAAALLLTARKWLP